MNQRLTAMLEQPLIQKTLRDHYECLLMEHFSGKLHGVSERNIASIMLDEHTSYHFSYLGFNNYNTLLQSSNFPRGLVYQDNDALFGVGIFFDEGNKVPRLELIAPHGEQWQVSVSRFRKKLRELIPNAVVMVRHLSH